ncbi:MAG: trypsin-like peptidase domain-containing protein [Gemmatimonadales bacterium]
MKSRDELIRQQALLMAAYEKVKERLARYPNVVEVGIGIKETDGVLTGEGCIKIVVTEKKSERDLDPDEILPKTVEGIPTDVIVKPDKRPLAACTEDRGNYRPILGGIRVNNDRNGSGVGGSGTLGCLAKRVSDDAWVILSNHHVLYGNNGQDGDKIGQPAVGCSWCCKTNVIAINVDKDVGLDCAIAKVEDDIAIENRIRDIGDIRVLGATAAVNGERVRKMGARTGLTSGDISFISPTTKEITITPRPAGGPANDPGGCTNYLPGGATNFAFYGDSGSVVVNDDGEVVGLLYAIDGTTQTQGFANDIVQVQNKLNISIKTTSSEPGRSPAAMSTHEPEVVTLGPTDGRWVERLEERLEETPNGRIAKNLIATHQEEVLALVNTRRPVTVVWQRKQGPAFLAAFSRSVRHSGYPIPREINRVSIQNLLMSMATVLEEHGSPPLRRDIRRLSLDVIRVCRECETAEELVRAIEALPVGAEPPAPVLTS